jgi:pyridoxamine 5'-phosphate oxidase
VKELNSQPRTVTPPLFSDLPPACGWQIGKERVICFDILAVKLFHQSGEPTGVNVTKSKWEAVTMSKSDIACSGVDGVPAVREFAPEPFCRGDLLEDPMALFGVWYEVVSDDPLSSAVVLSTASASASPSSRVVLLKAHDPRGFTIFTNYSSRKARQLAENAQCSLLFWWPSRARQVRVEGRAVRVSSKESDAYFASRPRGSQIGAWASPQSAVLKDREDLRTRVALCAETFGEGVIPRPDHWGGFRIEPQYLEFWQGGEDRLHDRFAYSRLESGAWHVERLAP